ncbi:MULTISPECIES: YlxR family protein [unclassified Rathayibacter]|uniref:YlxR family protein n=1 Tax=unclassified Rathayibacter TaxID=2609250 RepID=UPI00188B686B|nr:MULTISPECIES: YlxR family protein [unclassified Rathayibacter]MBF4461929.1 YlxR family protein [Rathayibacter sp. VKM Ac-2879]MBF4504028.1 YlxR family protein [Rathayibacter sp. VKM Ac-2878]
MDPVRTCVGCRLRASRASLLRLVLHSNVLAVDPRAVRAGRGAWLHDAYDCYELALKRRAFARAFRTRESVDASELERYVTRGLTGTAPQPEEPALRTITSQREQAERPVN